MLSEWWMVKVTVNSYSVSTRMRLIVHIIPIVTRVFCVLLILSCFVRPAGVRQASGVLLITPAFSLQLVQSKLRRSEGCSVLELK
eukprot:scaffold9695_cov136-Skeletonema_marinoi.AAC.2